MHQPIESLCDSGIGTSVSQTALRDAVTFCSDGTARHVGLGLYGCGNDFANAIIGIDCVADHYWNLGTSAWSGYAAAQVNTTLSAMVHATDTKMSVTSLNNIFNGTVLQVDGGPNAENVTVSGCTGTGGKCTTNPITVTAFANAHSALVNVIGAFLQCTDVVSNRVDPYDDRLDWVTDTSASNPLPTPSPGQIVPALDDNTNAVNSFTNHWTNSGSGDGSQAVVLTNEAFQYSQATCGAGAGSGLPKVKMGNNLASQFYRLAAQTELRGVSSYPTVSIDGISLTSFNYNWLSAGSTASTAALCPSGGCLEPSDHVNEYPIIWWDRGYTIPDCLTGTSAGGAFIEIDPSYVSNNPLLSDPNWDAARLTVMATLDHATTVTPQLGLWLDGTSRLDGRPFQFIVNGGDCQNNTQPVFQSSFAWQSGNVLAVNSENPFADTSTCNDSSGAEPTRYSGRAQFALNSETVFIAHGVAWENETDCPQNGLAGPNGGQSDQNNGGASGNCSGGVKCAGGFDDVSLRYWIIANELLFSDYRYVWSRHDFIGSQGEDANAFDVVGEDFFVFRTPVVSVAQYVEGSNPTGNGCSGNLQSGGTATDSGGLVTTALHASGTCVATGDAGTPFFKDVPPAIAQQWGDCRWAGVPVGPCAVIINYSNTKYMDSSSGFSTTFGNQGGELYPYSHIFNLNDSGGVTPCGGSAAGGTNVSQCAQDVFEPTPGLCVTSAGPIANFDGKCGSISSYNSQSIVVSGASSQSTTCTQGILSGTLTVCAQEALLLFS